MSYTIRADIELKPHPIAGVSPQAVFALDTGDFVALAVVNVPTPAATLACTASAWLVDAEGDAQAVAGIPVLVQFPHTADVQQITTLGVQGIAAALRDLLLGEAAEDPPAIAWSDALSAQVNIRNVIAVARAAGDPIDLTQGTAP
ncbi:hypothetical protein [Thermomonas sp.]